MSAADILSDVIEHGTVAGYRAGCTTAHCPAAAEFGISCSTAFVRYQGDYGFRRRVDAGATLLELAAVDAESKRAAVEARDATLRRLATPAPAPRPQRVLRQKRQPSTAKRVRPAAPAVAVDHELVARVKARMAAETIATYPGVDPELVERVRARMAEMQSPRAKKEKRPPAKKEKRPRAQVHGTVYGFQRGCKTDADCPNHAAGGTSCRQAHRDYHRAYIADRRANLHSIGRRGGIIRHGSPSGYQLGCHDRSRCPGAADGITCADASLAAERARRRTAGAAPRELVAAAPTLQHIQQLRENGMSINDIAAAAGVPRNAIATLLYGKYGSGYNGRIPDRITTTNAQKILAVTLHDHPFDTPTRKDPS